MRAESEGLLGRAWLGIAAKIGHEAKRRQAAMAFDALYDKQQTEGEERQDEDDNQSKSRTGGTEQHKEHSKRIQGAENKHDKAERTLRKEDDESKLRGEQGRQARPNNNDENRDELPHVSAVTNPEDRREVIASLVLCPFICFHSLYCLLRMYNCFYLPFARTAKYYSQ